MAEPHPWVQQVHQHLTEQQHRLCESLASWANGPFVRDDWIYQHGDGGGCTAVLQDTAYLEKAGVNVSRISGASLPQAATQLRSDLQGQCFEAVGLSLVIHPRNPYAPTVHSNVRLFLTSSESPRWWFGGGSDLTPYYGFVADAQLWHRSLQAMCAPYGADVYQRFKAQCDRYFYLPHRQEHRGIGGIFFDDLHEWGFDTCFSFIQAVVQHLSDTYTTILQRRAEQPYGERERQFQCHRRGRYVEFNLLHDRGTLFGLQSGGRVESILMSLPPEVRWSYRAPVEPDSVEARLVADYLTPRDWI